jgi:hypothetical protein
MSGRPGLAGALGALAGVGAIPARERADHGAQEAGAFRLVVLSVLLSLAALGLSEALARRLRARSGD